MSTAEGVKAAAELLREETRSLAPALLKGNSRIDWIYHPLDYAWLAHESYIERFSGLGAKTLLVGMNPGHGMGNTGVPFGCPEQVRDYLQIRDFIVEKPPKEHPKRIITGLACQKPEVSGRRIWSFLGTRWGSPEDVHRQIYIVNHCPLWMFDDAGRNITPDKLSGSASKQLAEVCDTHLKLVASTLGVNAAIGLGRYSHRSLLSLFDTSEIRVGYVPHPSPASPFANRNGGKDWRDAFNAALSEAESLD
jgi:single-strand selective monofunctional uracil DNA glycosylase